MMPSSEKIRKYGAFIGKTMIALFLAVLISGISTAWARDQHHHGHYKKGYGHHERGRYGHGRHVYRHHHYYPYYPHYRPYPYYYAPYPVYVPPPVYYAPPPPPPWGITIFAPPIIIHP